MSRPELPDSRRAQRPRPVAPAPRGQAPGRPVDAPSFAPPPEEVQFVEPVAWIDPHPEVAPAPASPGGPGVHPDLVQVPAPGGRYVGGRGKHVGAKVALVVTGCVLALGGAGVGGAAFIKATQEAPEMVIGPHEAMRFRLDPFPLDAAGAFAEQYVRTCLSPVAGNEVAAQRRDALIEAWTVSETGQCGMTNPNIGVVSTAATGARGHVEGRQDSARYIGVRVTLADARVIDVVVPVWTPTKAPGSAFMVVGSIGVDPAPPVAEVPSLEARSSDSALGVELRDALFNEFFTAWAQSNTTILDRFATRDATAGVRLGVGQSMGTPTVRSVGVLLPLGISGGSHAWSQGDRAVALVVVDWAVLLPAVDEHSESSTWTLTTTYRVGITLTGGGWFVQSIDAGAGSVAGDVDAEPEAPGGGEEAPAVAPVPEPGTPDEREAEPVEGESATSVEPTREADDADAYQG